MYTLHYICIDFARAGVPGADAAPSDILWNTLPGGGGGDMSGMSVRLTIFLLFEIYKVWSFASISSIWVRSNSPVGGYFGCYVLHPFVCQWYE